MILQHALDKIRDGKLLKGCGLDVISAFLNAIDEESSIKCEILLDLATLQLHAYHYKDVPIFWRQLFVDVSILKASLFMKEKENWMESIRVLDTAIIMSGAPERIKIVLKMIEFAQSKMSLKISHTPYHNIKRRRLMNTIKSSKYWSQQVKPMNLAFPLVKYNDPPSLDTFLAKHIRISIPCVICNAVKHWPVFTDDKRYWGNTQALLDRIGNGRIVPVEIGGNYTAKEWGQSIIPFEEFIQETFHNDIEDDCEKIGNIENTNSSVLYLAQHDLFFQFPILLDDIHPLPDYCAIRKGDILLNAWFGPKGTLSPAHTDPYDNLLVQIKGQKYIRLFDPLQKDKLYIFEDSCSLMTNTSCVDVENANMEEYPLLKDAKYFEAIISEGDMLFIPKGWYHHVRSLDPSMSVSLWWSSE